MSMQPASTKRLGLIGGMSWESTASYYRLINEGVKASLGGLHSARLAMVSVDFDEIERLQRAGDWEAAGGVLAEAAQALHAAGSGALVLCTNTMHRVSAAIDAATPLPLLHIADATADALADAGVTRVGLLGTRFTMEQAFYRDRLRDRHGLDVRIPCAADRTIVHDVIYDELCRGDIRATSRAAYRRIMATLVEDGVEAIVLGCTEIGLLVDAADAPVPLFDTTAIHARAAVRWLLSDA